MKTLVLVLSLLLILFANISTLCAAIITVDNKYPYVGDYQTLQAAHDAATSGDIIYVYPSMVPYSAITVTKQLTFYGVGFDITENIGEPFTPSTSISGVMNFNAGSQGSWLEGFDGLFIVYIYVNNVTIKRNLISYIIIESGGSGCAIYQNKLLTTMAISGVININSSCSNVVISNNLVIHENSNNYHGIINGTDMYVFNNIIKIANGYCIASVNGSEFVNNIIISGRFSTINNTIFRYNMYYQSNSNLSTGISNLENVDMNTVFVDHDNYDFHLLPGSPAIGAGEFGTDMGIYGGDAPYVDGGFPGLPSILQILAPTVGSQQSGLDIQFKAKSNNE